MDYVIAQVNIGRLVAPLDSPQLADFVSQLDAVNAVADSAPGFVWRLQSDDGDATSFRVFDDDQILLNMSVWDSIEALHEYVYRSGHVEVLRQRRQWAEPFDGVQSTMWWVRAGELPEPSEAVLRLARLERDGPTADAFTFQRRFEPPEEPH